MPAVNIPNSFFQHDAQAFFDPSTHIDPGFSLVDKFITQGGNNVLIEGIRGTGKTHILKMINAKYIERFNTKNVLPVYVSMTEVAEHAKKEETLFRIHLNSLLIKRTIETIKTNREIWGKRNTGIKKILTDIAGLFGIIGDNNIEVLLDKIERINRQLEDEVLLNTTRITDVSKSIQNAKAGVKHGVFNFDGGYGQENSESVEYLKTQLSNLNATYFISKFFENLNGIFNLQHTVLLLDEISDLPNAAQIEVFRLLKFIRGGTRFNQNRNYLYFIGGVYPPQATKYPSKINGDDFDFDLGNDCSVEHLELDVLLEFYGDFFKNLTLAKMKKHNPSLGNIQDIFEDEKAFILLAYAAHGLPRRFFEIMHHAYESLVEFASSRPSNDTKNYKVRYSDVTGAIDNVTRKTIIGKNKITKEDQEILDQIITALSKRNKKVATENETKQKNIPTNFYINCPRWKEDKLGNLIAKGILHDQARTRTLKHYVEGMGGKGIVVMIDLSVAFTEGAIPNRAQAADVFKNDTKSSAKNGYEYCQTITIK